MPPAALMEADFTQTCDHVNIKKVYYEVSPRKIKYLLKQSLSYSVKLYFMCAYVQIPLVTLFLSEVATLTV